MRSDSSAESGQGPFGADATGERRGFRRSRRRRWNEASLGARLAAYAVLAFMHLPVLVIVLYAFTTADRTYEFPPPGLTLHWFAAAFARADIWAAMRLSLAV